MASKLFDAVVGFGITLGAMGAACSVSPSEEAASDTKTRTPARTSHGSSAARKTARPGLRRPGALTSPLGVSSMRGQDPARTSRGARVRLRVTIARPSRSTWRTVR